VTRHQPIRYGLMSARMGVCVAGLLASCWSASAAPASDCTTAAAILTRERSELPRLEVASPADRPPYCITLETLIAFAGRVKAHVAHCPGSELAPTVANWDKTQADYSKLFSQRRCKRTR
jgi:hypothetical protein